MQKGGVRSYSIPTKNTNPIFQLGFDHEMHHLNQYLSRPPSEKSIVIVIGFPHYCIASREMGDPKPPAIEKIIFGLH